MIYKILPKDKLNSFITALTVSKKVYAPVDRGNDNYSFEEVKDAKNIALKYIPTILPPKKYLMPQYETLLKFNSSVEDSFEKVFDCEDMVLFGVHTCDLMGIQCLNLALSDDPKDENYLARKKRAFIIGYECDDYCDEHASCALVKAHVPSGGYDMFFTDLGDYFMVHVNTAHAEELVNKLDMFVDVKPEHNAAWEAYKKAKQEKFKREISVEATKLPEIFAKAGESKVWEELGKKCLACTNCTNVCPTCYCFDVKDVVNLDLKTGERVRRWDSCQSKTFAQITGGENFREERSERQKHRYYRKFKYPVDKYNRFFCTGCGRCTRTCMAKIDLKETLEELAKENA
jgi:sulfhydrogenase subunit beta (sulfur reductase)